MRQDDVLRACGIDVPVTTPDGSVAMRINGLPSGRGTIIFGAKKATIVRTTDA